MNSLFKSFRNFVDTKANPEQKQAIFSSGGVVLSAGAGSGKTFVLVHHLLVKIENIIEKNYHLGKEVLAIEIKKYLSETVLMTFTKKAAFEISLRVKKTILTHLAEQISEEEVDIWTDVLDLVDSINITTIDGFCYKVISSGLLSDLRSDFEICENWQSQLKISNIVSLWFSDQIEENSILDSVLDNNLNITNITQVLVHLYNDPLLHYEWKQRLNKEKEIKEQDCQEIFKVYLDYFEIHKLKKLRDNCQSIIEELSRTKKPPAFIENFKLLSLALSFDYDLSLDFISFFKIWAKTFDSIARLTTPKNNGEELIYFFEKIKLFRDKFEEVVDSFLAFEHDLELMNKWVKIHNTIFTFCETEYYKDKLLTFSDLEYLVCQSLLNERNAKELAKHYSYFIIDEFQDTSEIQFVIVRSIIGNDRNKLFVVGDVKQAIYGFRGGELEVFTETTKFLPNKLSLLTNYRSCNSIIDFNNKLFSFLFTNNQKSIVEQYEEQVPSNIKNNKGKIEQLMLKMNGVAELKSVSISDVEEFEAIAILKIIEGERDKTFTVLYSKLGPSLKLIRRLMEQNITFKAQVKIAQAERPVYGLLLAFLKFLLGKGSLHASDQFATLASIYLNILNSKIDYAEIKKSIDNVAQFNLMYGPFMAFRYFLLQLKISAIDLNNHLCLIEKYFDSYGENLEALTVFLEKKFQEDASVQFSYGSGNPRVVIMTVHASKGLEFDHVILGGINSNAVRFRSRSDLGEDPFSFKYKKGHQKYKTPWYVWEKIINEEKEAAESLRLFYVACTRAINSLSWIALESEDGEIHIQKKSWYYFLDLFLKTKMISDVLDTHIDSSSAQKSVNAAEVPLIYYNNLNYNTSENSPSPGHGVISELSVTKFSLIEECPHKFFLTNIVKLDEVEDFDEITAEEEFWPKINSSSKNRGSEIHLAINSYFNNSVKENLEKCLSKEKSNWLFTHFEEIKSSYSHLKIEWQSEKEFKFLLFSQMINAIPDLIIRDLDSGSALEIIDFKTGRHTPGTEGKYWTQLMCYAYGLFKMRNFSDSSVLKLKLMYLDEMIVLEKSLNKYEIDTKLFNTYQKLSDLNQYNRDACEWCKFKNVCLHCTESRVC